MKSNLTFQLEAQVREGYDDNVFLQNSQPNLALVPQAAPPHVGSFISVLTPRFFLDCRPASAFQFSVSYAPDFAFYYSVPSENHIAQRATANFTGRITPDWNWELANTLNFTSGQSEGVYFGGTPYASGNAPALGGIPIRDRRDAFVYRGSFRTVWTREKFFIRPVASAYVHNFLTVQKTNTFLLPGGAHNPDFGYENYVDRNEFAGGVDVGYVILPGFRCFVGYRCGAEGQGTMVGSPYQYNQVFNRPLGGFEGQPISWLKVALALGDDIHHTTSDNIAPGFKANYSKLWSDTTLSFLPTPADTIAFRFTRNTQPAFSSPSVYDDTAYDLTGRHVFGPRWTAGAGIKLYNGDWFQPVLRNDWVYTASALLVYRHNPHLSTELAYSFDWTDCEVPQLPDVAGREYTRNLVWLTVRYAF